jgi:hypothetical protein
MSYEPHDEAWDEAYERLSEELYPEHREQAIVEFTDERLRSYYLDNPDILAPAKESLMQATSLLASGHFSAALVFAATANELFLKGSLLRPIVFGLVHSPAIAQLVVESAMTQTGFSRYAKLLAGLYRMLTFNELATVTRPSSTLNLLKEASNFQQTRNQILHQGAAVSEMQAREAVDVSKHVFNLILLPVLEELSLTVDDAGRLRKYAYDPTRDAS